MPKITIRKRDLETPTDPAGSTNAPIKAITELQKAMRVLSEYVLSQKDMPSLDVSGIEAALEKQEKAIKELQKVLTEPKPENPAATGYTFQVIRKDGRISEVLARPGIVKREKSAVPEFLQ